MTDRNIHMFWNTPNPPDWVMFSYNRYKELNPTWNVMLHIGFEELLSDTEFEHYDLYKKMFDIQYENNKSIARLSDIIRVYFIHKYGGIWVDCDTYPLKSFDELYGKNFSSQYVPTWFDLFTFGVFNNREQLCLDTIKYNIDNFPVRTDKGPYYGFEYTYLIHRLNDYHIMFSHESQKNCDDFKKCIVNQNEQMENLINTDENFRNNSFSRHFEIENRHRSYTEMNDTFLDIVIINFNTNEYTNNCIRSILKFVKSIKYRLILFDNSNKITFELADDVKNKLSEKCIKYTYMDNTKQQLINFSEMHKLYCKDVSGNDYGSANHSYTIDWLIHNLKNSFILIESDTFLFNDIDFIDQSCFTVAPIEYSTWWGSKPRFEPYIQYFNIDLLKKNNIHHFDPNRILGGMVINSKYDCGASFYEDITKNNYKYKSFDYTKYIMHLRRASWKKESDENIKNFFDKCNEYLRDKKFNILVLQASTSNLEYQYSKTQIINEEYCKKYNYDYKFINLDSYNMNNMTPHNLKSQVIKTEILNGMDKYDWVMWIDSDAWFNNFNIDISNVLIKHDSNNIDLIIAHDQPNQDIPKNWIWGYVNTGVMLFKTTTNSITILDSWSGISSDGQKTLKSITCLNDQPKLCAKILFDEFINTHTKVINAEEINQFTTYNCFNESRDKNKLIYHSPGLSRTDNDAVERKKIFEKLTFEKINEIKGIKVLPYSNDGNFGNQIFFALMSYAFTKKNNVPYIYIYDALKQYDYNRYNLNNYINYKTSNKPQINHNSYYEVFSDYYEYLYDFFKDTFCSSQTIKSKFNPITDKVLLHIRLGDYLKPENSRFGTSRYNDYLEKSCKMFNEKYNLTKCDVITDSSDYFVEHHSETVSKYLTIENVIHSDKSIYDDLETSISYKYAINTHSSYIQIGMFIRHVLFNGEDIQTQILIDRNKNDRFNKDFIML